MEFWEQIARHLRAVARETSGAWEELLVALSPKLETLARRQPIGRLRDDEDAQRDIIAKVIGRLHASDHKTIKKWATQDDPPPLQAWIRVLVRSAAIDVMRARPEFIRGSHRQAPGWFSLATLVTQAGAHTPNTLAAKQREVEEFLARAIAQARSALDMHEDDAAAQLATDWKIPAVHTRRLLKRIDEYERILAMALAGHSYVEIGETLDLSRREVELIAGYIEEFFHIRGFAA